MEERKKAEDEARKESYQAHDEQMAQLQEQLFAVANKAAEDRKRNDERIEKQERDQ